MVWNEHEHKRREQILWEEETQRWLEDIRGWRADREQELEVLRRLVGWMEERERILNAHEESIATHREAVAAHAQALEERERGEPDEIDGWSDPLHRRTAVAHEAERARHLALGSLHKAAMAQLDRLVLMMDPTRLPEMPRSRRGGAVPRMLSDKT
ncbi:MAG: hypothetical protein ACQEXJ_10505 [Myxococcota bacterium]